MPNNWWDLAKRHATQILRRINITKQHSANRRRMMRLHLSRLWKWGIAVAIWSLYTDQIGLLHLKWTKSPLTRNNCNGLDDSSKFWIHDYRTTLCWRLKSSTNQKGLASIALWSVRINEVAIVWPNDSAANLDGFHIWPHCQDEGAKIAYNMKRTKWSAFERGFQNSQHLT